MAGRAIDDAAATAIPSPRLPLRRAPGREPERCGHPLLPAYAQAHPQQVAATPPTPDTPHQHAHGNTGQARTRKLYKAGTRRQRRVYARRGTLAGSVALPSTQLALQRPSYESARLARTAGAKWSGRAGPGAGAGALGISESALRSGRSGGTAPCSSSRRPGPPVE